MIFGPNSVNDESSDISLVTEPPLKDPIADTDQETNKCDDEVEGYLDHLFLGIRVTSCEIAKSNEYDFQEDLMEDTLQTEQLSEPPAKRVRFKKCIKSQSKKVQRREGTSKTQQLVKK